MKGACRFLTIVDVSDNEITLDGNHPLAGKNLLFDVEIIDIREATEEEIEYGLEDECGCGDSCGDGCGGGCSGCS